MKSESDIFQFLYNPISNITTIIIKGNLGTKNFNAVGNFKHFNELPDQVKEVVKELYADVNSDVVSIADKITASIVSQQSDHLNHFVPYLEHNSNLGASIVELNVENATLLKYIKEIYGEFIKNDLSTEDKLNAKQLTIKEWVEK